MSDPATDRPPSPPPLPSSDRRAPQPGAKGWSKSAIAGFVLGVLCVMGALNDTGWLTVQSARDSESEVSEEGPPARNRGPVLEQNPLYWFGYAMPGFTALALSLNGLYNIGKGDRSHGWALAAAGMVLGTVAMYPGLVGLVELAE